MAITLCVDFGSTYTKLAAVDLDDVRSLVRVQSPTTVADITIGLDRARQELAKAIGKEPEIERILACSSAAGGLRMVAIGLVPELTAEAAKRAALGAGAKVIEVFSYQLSPGEKRRLEEIAPDLVLLAGGTDGGNQDVILHNAQVIAASNITAPVIVAGNKVVAEQAAEIMERAGKPVRVTENVLPELGKLNVEPARAVIREVFMARIVHAKGLDKAEAIVGDILMPTPMAVLRGAELISKGTPDEPGLGELIVIDVGGATTDVHSVAEGLPTMLGVQPKGLPEPYAKRTVEGDLGIRFNAQHIVSMAGERRVRRAILAAAGDVVVGDIAGRAAFLSDHIDAVAETGDELAIDLGLARTAVEMATERHAGRLEVYYLAGGMPGYLQYGKDLTAIPSAIATGGIFAFGPSPDKILAGTLFDETNQLSLKPKNPTFYIDQKYILYAVGLLAEHAPDAALRLFRAHLRALAGVV